MPLEFLQSSKQFFQSARSVLGAVGLNEEHVIFYDLLQFLFGRMQHGTFCDSISRPFDSLNEGCAKVGIAQDETPVNSPDIGLAASFSTDRYLARRVYGCPENGCHACFVCPYRSPQKLSLISARKCWKCSVIGIIFAIGCRSPFFGKALACEAKANLHPLAFYTINVTSPNLYGKWTWTRIRFAYKPRRLCKARPFCGRQRLLAFWLSNVLLSRSSFRWGSLGAGDCSCFVDFPFRHARQLFQAAIQLRNPGNTVGRLSSATSVVTSSKARPRNGFRHLHG